MAEMASDKPGKKVRFDDFEVDFGRFQLSRAGQPVRLESLPLALLMFLISNHRQLVDVEQGINTAIRKVRMALEDDSIQPRYLQTVVGRGYRFVPEISMSGGDADAAAEFKISAEEFGQALMAAAGLHPEDLKVPTKERDDS
jgi:DNA-binding winged helix-turn-helix (wHTH) protein